MVELPDPDEPEPVTPLPAPVLGEVVLLPEPMPELELPLAPLAPELDLLKWASHSKREIWPSLLVSTDEKVGADVLEVLGMPLEPDAEGVLLPEDEDELCAMATPDKANSAAAVALVTSFSID